MSKLVKTTAKRAGWMIGAASLVLGFAGAAQAQTATPEAEEGAPESAQEIVVPAEIQYRDRADTAAPVLEYDADYFQRFEPLTVGDALKRVPSVAFLSDVLESDGVRLRGLDPAYTQILINGEKVPGSGSSSGAFGNGADTAFFVDRIPAELIERVEVVRSASANRSGDALAGAINIVLRDGLSLDGGYVRAGVLYFEGDRDIGETASAVWGGQVLNGRGLFGVNLQDRHNPKRKFSARYDNPTAALNNIEDQTDTRDGTDYSANFAWEGDAFGGEVSMNGFYVRTDRYENEDSIEYRSGLRDNANLLTLNDNNVDIKQNSWSFNTEYEIDLFGGETEFKFGYANFSNKEYEFEDETEYLRDAIAFPEGDRFTSDQARLDLQDRETSFDIEHELEIGDLEVEFGVQTEFKERKNRIETVRARGNLPAGTQAFQARPNPIPVAPGPFAVVPGGDNTIERTRIDPFVMLTGETGPFTWEAGLRWENTELKITDRTVGGAALTNDYSIALPSASVKWELTPDDRVIGSIARTVRNQPFNFISPAVLETELEDNDFVGNPNLKPESAWGFDVGYERRLGKTGVVGVNVFYRSVSDLIEIANTGVVGSEGAGAFVYTARNTGDGTVFGVEFDLSTPLTVFGLENTGVFLNYSWLDSDVDDEFGSRRFNSQAEYVFNAGFIQDVPELDFAFGATYREQGTAFSRIVSEEVRTEYGADLEVFFEKRLGSSFTVRLTGSNLLDAEKKEFFNKFLTAADQRARAFDEYEFESENAGPVYQIIGRYAF